MEPTAPGYRNIRFTIITCLRYSSQQPNKTYMYKRYTSGKEILEDLTRDLKVRKYVLGTNSLPYTCMSDLHDSGATGYNLDIIMIISKYNLARSEYL